MQLMTYEQRVEVTQRIITVLDDWGVTDSDQVKLLGLPDGTRSRIIRSYRKDAPLPEDEKVFERVDHFAGIAHALWTSNPRNSQAGALWMNQTNKHFQQRTPMQIMLEDGLQGIEAIRIHLDCSYDWHINGK